MSHRNVGLFTALAAAAALAAPGCGSGSRGSVDPHAKPASFTLPAAQRSRIRVETLAATAFTRTVDVTGTVAFDGTRATQVLAPVSGPVSRLLVDVGERVRAGQPLATVASPDFAAAVSAYRKALATARNARRIADLDAKLFADDAIARRERDQAETDAVSAEADRDAALQQLRSLGVDGSVADGADAGGPAAEVSAAIRAPLTGTVVERFISPGQLLSAGATPCFTVADLSTVWVMGNVFESDLPFVAVGDPAAITGGAWNGSIEGKVTYVSAIVDPATRAITVRIATPNPRDELKKDMYVRVAIRSRRPVTGLLVPTSAVLRDDENLPFVYLENPDGSFSRRAVTVGWRIGDREEISAGLSAGDRVVVEGGLFMQFAQSQ